MKLKNKEFEMSRIIAVILLLMVMSCSKSSHIIGKFCDQDPRNKTKYGHCYEFKKDMPGKGFHHA